MNYEKHALRVSQVIAAVAKVSCKHGLWLVDRVNTKNRCLTGSSCPAAIFYIPVSLTSANITSFSSSRAPYVAACGPYENLAFQSMSHTWQARPCFHENSAGSC